MNRTPRVTRSGCANRKNRARAKSLAGAIVLLTSAARGVFPIAPTPFFDDGRIDTVSIDRLTDFYLRCGATGLTVLGQLGEAPKLSHEEGVAIAGQMIRRAPQLPI